jgi:hypothetical protein
MAAAGVAVHDPALDGLRGRQTTKIYVHYQPSEAEAEVVDAAFA